MSSILKVDTINEVTSANGVTVDGLSIKDSKLVTADSVVTANITNSNITVGKMAANSVDSDQISATFASKSWTGLEITASNNGIASAFLPWNTNTFPKVACAAPLETLKLLLTALLSGKHLAKYPR